MLHQDMMSFGYVGNGGLSSASNLSPLAPPFTVDRTNQKFDANPISSFCETNTYGLPFSSSLHNWQYPHSSASGPEYYSNYESGIGSLHTTDYSYLGSEPINPPSVHWAPPNTNTTDPTINPFSYSGVPKQYYPPYQVVDDNVSSVVPNEANYELLSSSGLVPGVGSSQVDYSQGLSSLEFVPPWGGYWNGLSEGNCGRRTDIDGSFHFEETDFRGSHGYRDYLNQEVVPAEFLRGEENSTASQRKYADVTGREKNAGSLAEDHLNSLCQNLRFSATESSSAPIFGTSTKFTESNLELHSLEPVTFSGNLPKSNSVCGKGLQLFDSCISDCTSVTKTSVIPVIRPPVPGMSFTVQDTSASKSINTGDTTADNKKDVSSNQTIEKEPLLRPNSEVKEGFLDANHLGFHTSRNDQCICSPASSSLAKPLSKNSLNHGIKVRRSQIPDINVPHGSTMSVDSTEAFKHIANTTENLDNYNPAEDSPCWKGAPASNVSPFEFLEAIPPQNRSKKLETRDLLDFEAVQRFPREFILDFSSQVCGPDLRKENLSTYNTKAVLSMENLDVTLPAKELSAADDARLKSDGVQQNRNDRDHYSSNVEIPKKQYSLLNSSKSDSGSVQSQTKQLYPNMAGAVDAGISTSDTLEDGCIPLHYVENVLYSPPSEENDGKPPATDPSKKVNVQTLASALHNISELLLLYSVNDEWELKEQDSKTLEHAMSNINMCLSNKIVRLTPKEESMFFNAGTPHILKEGAKQLGLHATDEVGNTTVDDLASYSIHQKKRIFGKSDKEIEKNMDLISLKNDAEITRHHNMVQSIKKVLDENFQLEEDVSSKTLLYKNLWLNAEAELCVTGLMSRFDKVKIQLEDCQPFKTKETVVVKKTSSSDVSPDPCLDVASGLNPEANDSLKQKTSVPSISSTKSDVNDDEASVMARLQILKCRGDNINTSSMEEKSLPEVDQPDDTNLNDIDESVMARLQILKCRGDNMNTSNVEEKSLPDVVQPDVNDVENSVMAGFQILKWQGDNVNTSNVKEKSLPEDVQPIDTDVENSVMAGFEILKCQGDNINTSNVEEKSLPYVVQSDDADVEDSVMAGFQILKCQGYNIHASNVEEKSPPDVIQPDCTDFGVPWQIVGSQTGNKSFDVAVGSRIHRHSDRDNAKNVGSSPYDAQHETVKEFSVYAPDDSTTIKPISMHNELASGSIWHKNTPSHWDDSTTIKPRRSISMHNEHASRLGWNKKTPDSDDTTTIQPHRNISMHNEFATHSGWHKNTPLGWDDSTEIQPRINISIHNEFASGSGWHKDSQADWDDSTSVQPHRNISMHDELASSSVWHKNTPADWDNSTIIQPRRNISTHNELASGSVWHKNTPADWEDSTIIQSDRNISMHNELASGSSWPKNTPADRDNSATIQSRNISMNGELASGSGWWYGNTPLDWEHVLKDDYEWQK